MANYQTLTEINDLISKIEILKNEKETLRISLKNLKLESSQNLYLYKTEKRKQSRIKIKSVIFKQNLLTFKEKEMELIAKIKEKYRMKIEENFEFLIKNICDRIAIGFFENRPENNSPNEVICSKFWQEMIENCGFDNITNKETNEKKDLVLRIILDTKIYLLDKSSFIPSLVEYLVTQNLPKIAKIKIKDEEVENLPNDNRTDSDKEMNELETDGKKLNQTLENKEETEKLGIEDLAFLKSKNMEK